MIPVQDVIPTTLAELIRKAPFTTEKVAFAWRLAVGQVVARATTIALRDHVLHVVAKDLPWRREIERNTTVIRTRLDGLLGPGVIREVRVENEPTLQRPLREHTRD